MSQSYLLISDIHNRTALAQRIMDSVPHDHVICLGDFFDFYGDSYVDALKTAAWVKNQLDNNPKFVAIHGNHTTSYCFPDSECANCSGFTRQKSEAINSILSRDDWNKFKMFYYIEEGNWMCSHAGLDKRVFVDSLLNDREALQKSFDIAIDAVSKPGGYHTYFGAGRDRGGNQPVGGCVWCDFRSINPVSQYNQIVGHTIHSKPEIVYRHKENKSLKYKEFNNNMTNPFNAKRLDTGDCVICIDTNNRHYGLITDGVLTVNKVEDEELKKIDDANEIKRIKDMEELFKSVRM